MKIFKNKINFFLILIVCFLSCKNETKFNPNTWNIKNDIGQYTFRKDMINDIIENDLVKGKSVEELEKMFGPLQVGALNNQSMIIQNIEKDFASDIDPVGSTDFIIYLDNEGKVINSEIKSYQK